ICPATSTDTEHAFSGGGLTMSWMRHSLVDKSTHVATVLASWASVSGIIPEADLIKRFKDKKKQENNGKQVG
ncbi:hypothetical protein K439DRAFT_1361002, partial [Ramaria rubella]